MLRLKLPKEPYWLDLVYNIRVKVRPLTTAVYQAARQTALRKAAELYKDAEEIEAAGGAVEGLPEFGDAEGRSGLVEQLFIQALANVGIEEWDGVYDENDNPAPVSKENLDEAMRVHQIAEDFLTKYLRPHDDLLREGEPSTAGPNGTGAAGTDTASDAEKKTPRAAEENAAPTESDALTSNTSPAA